MFEAPGIGRCLVAPDGSILRANAEWLRSTGLGAQGALGADIIQLFPERRDMALALHARARAGHHVAIPRHVLRVRGREAWWEGSISPVELDGGTGLLITEGEVSGQDPRDRDAAPPRGAPHETSEHRRHPGAGQTGGESELRLRLLFENMLDGFAYCQMVLDERGRPIDFVYLEVNGAFEKLTGLRDVVGKRVSEVIPGIRESEPELLETYGRVARTGQPEHFEIHFRPLDLWFAIAVYSPRPGHFVAVFDNITGRKRAEEERSRVEEALRKERGLIDSVTKATDVMLVYLDPDFNFVWVNERYAATCRMRPEELVGMNHFALYPHEENQAIFRRVRDSGEAVFQKDRPFEFPDQPGRGVTYWDWSLVPVRDASGPVLGLVFSLRETTRYKLAELALSAAKERLTADLDAMSRLHRLSTRFVRSMDLGEVLDEVVEAAIAIAHADMGNVQLLDRASGRLRTVAHRGYDQAWLDFSAGVAEGPGASCGAALQQRARVVVEDVATSPVFAGTPAREVQLRAGIRAEQSTPLLGSSGNLVGLISTHYRSPPRLTEQDLRLLDLLARQAADLVERAQAEEALRKANEAVAESNKRLIEANRRKDEFLGMLSHELRNPLTPIRNSVYILERASPAGEQAARARAVIQRQTEHLARLVDDLLDVTRIAHGKVELRRKRVDLGEVVRRAAEDLGSVVENRGVTLAVDMPGDSLWVDADATRIAQVIGNLLQNAAKFTRAGDSVTVSMRSTGRLAEVSVRDTGAGIEPELLPAVFEAFVQGDRTLARTEGGLGLGLALVKGIVELHGGTVRAESAGKGRGAEFVIRLPLVEPVSPPSSSRP